MNAITRCMICGSTDIVLDSIGYKCNRCGDINNADLVRGYWATHDKPVDPQLKGVVSVELDCYRTGSAYLAIRECDKCHTEKLCLTVDGSDDEYGEIKLCLDCIQRAFNLFEANAG